jgi:hypothetical protein
MVMAGGGFRFGIYLGMHAAACDAGRAPDLLLASCGGALAATVIAALPDAPARRAWMNSEQMYAFWCALRSAPDARLFGTLWRAGRRSLARGSAATIPDLFSDYLFDLAPQLPFPPVPAAPSVDVAVIAGRLLFDAHEAGRRRGKRKLFAETVFGPPRVAALLAGAACALDAPRWGNHAVAGDLLTVTNTPTAVAARLSIADMFYFPPQLLNDAHYIGGVIDLFPVELARRLGRAVTLEFKEAFDQTFAIPAWRSVLGVDGNARLRYANGVAADVRIDTSDVSTIEQPMRQHLDWRRNRIAVRMPADHVSYVRHMDAQWEYGYQRGREAYARADAGDAAWVARNATRHSSASA